MSDKLPRCLSGLETERGCNFSGLVLHSRSAAVVGILRAYQKKTYDRRLILGISPSCQGSRLAGRPFSFGWTAGTRMGKARSVLQAFTSNWLLGGQVLVLFTRDATPSPPPMDWLETSRWCCTQVAAPASGARLTSFIIYLSCCTSLQEVLLEFVFFFLSPWLVAPWIS